MRHAGDGLRYKWNGKPARCRTRSRVSSSLATILPGSAARCSRDTRRQPMSCSEKLAHFERGQRRANVASRRENWNNDLVILESTLKIITAQHQWPRTTALCHSRRGSGFAYTKSRYYLQTWEERLATQLFEFYPCLCTQKKRNIF